SIMNSIISLILLSTFVNGGYIVTLKSNQRSNPTFAHLEKVRSLFNARIGDANMIGHIYNTTFDGYSAQFSKEILNLVKAMPEVDAVEEDQMAKISAVQRGAPWGLSRLSSKGRLGTNGRNLVYTHDPTGGQGVDVFVIDTGINIHHPDFQGRAIWGANFVNGSPNTDQNGHGSHCAGTIASHTYGVAKSATVIAVKVLDARGQGYNSQIIAGIEWAIRSRRGGRGTVINMSLGSGRSEATNRAVRAAVQAGIFVAVAAGNDNSNACNYSPASEPSVITVGATNIYDSRASFSNWGTCLDVFAPGQNIISTWNQGSGTNTISGTSMASPHVAGLAAYFITKSGNSDPNYIANLLKSRAQKNAISSVGYSSPNLLINNGENQY
ncbi:proteinase B, partial [Massospora cicadina]